MVGHITEAAYGIPVKITEALKLLQRMPRDAQEFQVALVCGFTPLHMQTFLAAHLHLLLPSRHISVRTGLYGDTAGTLESSSDVPLHAVAIALEWADIDPRLGFRSAGHWGPAAVTDILNGAGATLDRLAAAVLRLPAGVPVACSMPTLPLPPLFHQPGWQLGKAELTLQREMAGFAARLLERPGLSLVNRHRLDEVSPPASRYDLKSDLATGLPYVVPHADCVAEALARLLAPAPPKKGLITDLDDTLWYGLVGEIGPDNVCWDLASHHPLHGLYQNLLSSLAQEGVLIGIASKNEAAVAEQALARADILLQRSQVFPVEIHWNAKSISVARILQAWNIAADSVVFVDDSPMELAEVAAAHPGIECLVFPKGDPAAALQLLERLRDLFGKTQLVEEDAYRLESLRQGAVFQQTVAGGSGVESFLQQARAEVTLEFGRLANDSRTLELINKTNQFNLNGTRFTDADWAQKLERPAALLLTASYQDKYGRLGKIAVLAGWQDGDTLHVDSWVMSCRAFSRRIEHQCLRSLFDRTGASRIEFEFAATPKNGPLQEFFENLTGEPPRPGLTITRKAFEEKCPPLYHEIVEATPNEETWIRSQPV